MSLISEALKKAQRMRTSEPAAGSSPGVAGGPVVRRDQGLPAQSLVWIIAGAAVIVCAAVVTTVFLVRPAAPTLTLAKSAAAPPATNTSSVTPASPGVAPAVATPPKLPEAAPVKAESPAPVMSEAAMPPPKSAAPTLAPTSTTGRPATLPARLPPSVPVATAASSARPDPRIQSFVDAIKVAGIRSSGTDSKVLMNDKVYRVNDIVDRSLNLRLIDVQASSLSFVDENNVVYTKSF